MPEPVVFNVRILKGVAGSPWTKGEVHRMDFMSGDYLQGHVPHVGTVAASGNRKKLPEVGETLNCQWGIPSRQVKIEIISLAFVADPTLVGVIRSYPGIELSYTREGCYTVSRKVGAKWVLVYKSKPELAPNSPAAQSALGSAMQKYNDLVARD